MNMILIMVHFFDLDQRIMLRYLRQPDLEISKKSSPQTHETQMKSKDRKGEVQSQEKTFASDGITVGHGKKFEEGISSTENTFDWKEKEQQLPTKPARTHPRREEENKNNKFKGDERRNSGKATLDKYIDNTANARIRGRRAAMIGITGGIAAGVAGTIATIKGINALQESAEQELTPEEKKEEEEIEKILQEFRMIPVPGQPRKFTLTLPLPNNSPYHLGGEIKLRAYDANTSSSNTNIPVTDDNPVATVPDNLKPEDGLLQFYLTFKKGKISFSTAAKSMNIVAGH